MSAWQRLRAGNELFFVPTQGRQQTLHQGALVAAVFRCADTDVASEVVFGQSWGSLIDVSTWGMSSTPGCSAPWSTPSTPSTCR